MEKETKRCSRCGEIKPISEFYKRKSSKDGLMSYCKECQKAMHAEYYQSNKDALLKKKADYIVKNKEKIAQKKADYYSKNKERFTDYYNPQTHPMNWAKNIVARYRQTDREKGFDPSQTITADWFLENIMYKPCAHCGLLQVGAIGVNRKSNALGHIPSNCEPCCRNCNSRLGAIDQIERGLAWFQKSEKVDFKTFVNEHKAKHKNLV